MPVDITAAPPNRFRAQVALEASRTAPACLTKRAHAGELLRAVESTLIQAMAVADTSLPLNETLGLAIVSGEDCAGDNLHREEARILSPRACTKKRIEFTSGRAAAHSALKQIGFPNPPPVLRGARGQPLWPQGITGSISHCFPWNIAVAIRCPKRIAIGVDLEATEGAGATDISKLVCTKAELDWVRAGNGQERLAMIFSCKEAVYKAFYPFCRSYIDFRDVELTWLSEQARFQGRFLAPFGPNLSRGPVFVVHCRRCGELVFSCVIHRWW